MQRFVFCFKAQIFPFSVLIKYFHGLSFVSSSLFFLLDYIMINFTPSIMLSNNTNRHFHCWISVPNSVNYFFFAFHDYLIICDKNCNGSSWIDNNMIKHSICIQLYIPNHQYSFHKSFILSQAFGRSIWSFFTSRSMNLKSLLIIWYLKNQCASGS